jgi:hypothetical protein
MGEDLKARTTYHAQDRVKDRLGLSKKLADKKAQQALDFGVSHGETKGNLHRYYTYLYFHNQTANNIRVYNRKVYIFSNELLITVLNLPNHLSAAADKLQKRKKERLEEASQKEA